MKYVRLALVSYLVAVVGTFALAAVVKGIFGLPLAMKVQYAATCILILPFQFVAWIISWFSQTPGVIDQYAINTFFTWVFLIAIAYFGAKFLLKKFKQAWGALLGGGGGGGKAHTAH